MYKIFILAMIIVYTTAISFSVQIMPDERFCFYEVFDVNQKYSFLAKPNSDGDIQSDISVIQGRQWKQMFLQNTRDTGKRIVKAFKLASIASTYSFCVKNLQNSPMLVNITSNSGIQVMQLHELPDLSDAQNLDRELNWLSSQNEALKQRAMNLVGLRNTNEQIAMMVGTKMILFAIVGMLVILGVNFVFYKSLKKTFKDRKLI